MCKPFMNIRKRADLELIKTIICAICTIFFISLAYSCVREEVAADLKHSLKFDLYERTSVTGAGLSRPCPQRLLNF
jgi:hypothetical protein